MSAIIVPLYCCLLSAPQGTPEPEPVVPVTPEKPVKEAPQGTVVEVGPSCHDMYSTYMYMYIVYVIMPHSMYM